LVSLLRSLVSKACGYNCLPPVTVIISQYSVRGTVAQRANDGRAGSFTKTTRMHDTATAGGSRYPSPASGVLRVPASGEPSFSCWTGLERGRRPAAGAHNSRSTQEKDGSPDGHRGDPEHTTGAGPDLRGPAGRRQDALSLTRRTSGRTVTATPRDGDTAPPAHSHGPHGRHGQ
jgi:hypothetical protein